MDNTLKILNKVAKSLMQLQPLNQISPFRDEYNIKFLENKNSNIKITVKPIIQYEFKHKGVKFYHLLKEVRKFDEFKIRQIYELFKKNKLEAYFNPLFLIDEFIFYQVDEPFNSRLAVLDLNKGIARYALFEDYVKIFQNNAYEIDEVLFYNQLIRSIFANSCNQQTKFGHINNVADFKNYCKLDNIICIIDDELIENGLKVVYR